jgi:hypothetical protein
VYNCLVMPAFYSQIDPYPIECGFGDHWGSVERNFGS